MLSLWAIYCLTYIKLATFAKWWTIIIQLVITRENDNVCLVFMCGNDTVRLVLTCENDTIGLVITLGNDIVRLVLTCENDTSVTRRAMITKVIFILGSFRLNVLTVITPQRPISRFARVSLRQENEIDKKISYQYKALFFLLNSLGLNSSSDPLSIWLNGSGLWQVCQRFFSFYSFENK